jgi:ankyrin repeat protein
VDINGNTILHLAAKSNAINIAKILKHLYQDAKLNKSDSWLHQMIRENNKSTESIDQQLLFFDMNRTNLQD